MDLASGLVTTIEGGTIHGYVNGPALSAKFRGVVQIATNNGNIYNTDDRLMIRQTAPQ